MIKMYLMEYTHSSQITNLNRYEYAENYLNHNFGAFAKTKK